MTPPRAAPSGDAPPNQSVARALRILVLLASRSEPAGVREIARALGLASSIAQRLVTTLANEGFLERVGPLSRYRIGHRAFEVGNAFLGQGNLHSAVLPELDAIAAQQINGFLGVLREGSIVYLATVQSSGPVAITHRPGARTHLHSTAMGKAVLAELTEAEVRALLARPLPRLTPHTKVSLPQLLAELETVRRLGYATSEEENRLGFFSAGAVIRDASGASVAVISGAVPSAGLKAQDRARVARTVVEAAQRASRRLGASQAGRALLGAARPPVRKPDKPAAGRTAAAR